jgi:hypothetical protein
MKPKQSDGFSIVELILAIVVGVTFLSSMNLVTDNYTGTSSLSSELPSQLPGRSGTMTVSQPFGGIKRIDLSISYKDGTINRAYSYRTYIGELGVGQ